MKEIKILKELNLNLQLQIVGWMLVVSFGIKLIQKDHFRRFWYGTLKKMKKLNRAISKAFRPCLYEILPPRAQRLFDIIGIISSYFGSLIFFFYGVIFLYLSKYIDFSIIPLHKIALYGVITTFFFVNFLLLEVNGNKLILERRQAK